MRIENLFKRLFKKAFTSQKITNPLSALERIRLEKLERYRPATILFYGKTLKIADAPTFLSSYREIFQDEIYKFTTDKKDITIIDCGANIGLATIYFKMNFPQAKIIAFEPDPNIFNDLRENVLSFGFEDIVCKNEAVSDSEKTLNFHIEGGHSGMITHDLDRQNSIRVKATRLKTLINAHDNITFLKIDIEGHEKILIADISKELKRVEFLFLEYHSFLNSTQYLGEVLNIIKEAGMRYYMKESYIKKHPFIEREIFLEMDLIVNIFCFRDKANLA